MGVFSSLGLFALKIIFEEKNEKELIVLGPDNRDIFTIPKDVGGKKVSNLDIEILNNKKALIADEKLRLIPAEPELLPLDISEEKVVKKTEKIKIRLQSCEFLTIKFTNSPYNRNESEEILDRTENSMLVKYEGWHFFTAFSHSSPMSLHFSSIDATSGSALHSRVFLTGRRASFTSPKERMYRSRKMSSWYGKLSDGAGRSSPRVSRSSSIFF